MPVTARPRSGSSPGFHRARVKGIFATDERQPAGRRDDGLLVDAVDPGADVMRHEMLLKKLASRAWMHERCLLAISPG